MIDDALQLALADRGGFICLLCPLANCAEGEPGCFYQEDKSRKAYFRRHYRANRTKKLEQVKEWHRRNPNAPSQKKDRRDYFRKRYENNRESMLAKANERNALRRATTDTATQGN